MRTSATGIYAVGDAVEYIHAVTSRPALVPLAGPATRPGGSPGSTPPPTPLPQCRRCSAPRSCGCSGSSPVPPDSLAARPPPRDSPVPRAAGAGHDHATYYPGAAPLVLKVLYHREDGRLRGAQVVGRDGVDKRLDVLAPPSVWAPGSTQLAALDLAHAPPFGSARDPIQWRASSRRTSARTRPVCRPARSSNAVPRRPAPGRPQSGRACGGPGGGNDRDPVRRAAGPHR